MEITNKVTLPVIDIDGKIVGDLPGIPELFAVEPNESVVHFVCEGQRFRFYKKTVATKGRASVSGGGKKARQQKGSGHARQGGNRAPHWVGGGVAFGPTPVKRDFKINKKVRRLALASVLTDRHSGGQVRVLRSDLKGPKTKSVSSLLSKLAMQGARVGFVVSSAKDANLSKSVRNIRNVDLLTEERWTTLDFVKTDSLIFSEAAFPELNGTLPRVGRTMKLLADKIIQPLLSEKSSSREARFNEFAIVVEKKLTKTEIKAAVKQLFGVEALDVRTVNFRKKTKRTKYGLIPAKLYKKALIRLPEGKRIEFK